MTLNRTYHWPARTISATAPRPSPTPLGSNSRTTTGKSIGAGNDAPTWMTGCSARASRGERPITTPAGRAQAVARSTAPITRKNVSAAEDTSWRHSAQPSCPSNRPICHRPAAAPAAIAATSNALASLRATGCSNATRGPRRITGVAARSGPSNERVAQPRDQSPVERPARLRAHPGESGVPLSQEERAVHHQEEPATRNGKHPVPHHALGRGRELALPERARGPPPGDPAGVAQRLGDALERIVEAQGEVPSLGREDHQDGGQLEPDVARGKERHEAEHEAGQKPEHGDARQDVEPG